MTRNRAPAAIWVPALVVAAVMLLPVAYLVVRAWDSSAWSILAGAGTATLLWNTIALAATVTGASVVLGVGLAVLTARTDLPGRRTFGLLTAIPLVVPTYVGAYTLISAVSAGGLLDAWVGISWAPHGFIGAFITLTLFSYPYVLLTVRAALLGLDPAQEEASRGLGAGAVETFRRITLPQLRPSIGVGALLVALYTLSDFGAVSLLRYSTFTRAIYLQYQSLFDRTPAAVLGLVLVGLTAAVLWAETVASRRARERAGPARASTARQPAEIPLGRWRWPLAGACGVLVVSALAAPVAVTVTWLIKGISRGDVGTGVLSAATSSVAVSAAGAALAVLAAAPVATWAVRYPGRFSRLAERASFTGYALPGIVVALALVFFGARYAGSLYQTHFTLVFAYVVLFLPQALAAFRSSLEQVGPHVEQAARSLGSRPTSALVRVVLPLARRGAFAGGALVFLTAMKELPATLLLSPTGFDTLATRVWSASSEAFFSRAALPALLLIVAGSVPLAFLVTREPTLAR